MELVRTRFQGSAASDRAVSGACGGPSGGWERTCRRSFSRHARPPAYPEGIGPARGLLCRARGRCPLGGPSRRSARLGPDDRGLVGRRCGIGSAWPWRARTRPRQGRFSRGLWRAPRAWKPGDNWPCWPCNAAIWRPRSASWAMCRRCFPRSSTAKPCWHTVAGTMSRPAAAWNRWRPALPPRRRHTTWPRGGYPPQSPSGRGTWRRPSNCIGPRWRSTRPTTCPRRDCAVLS